MQIVADQRTCFHAGHLYSLRGSLRSKIPVEKQGVNITFALSGSGTRQYSGLIE